MRLSKTKFSFIILISIVFGAFCGYLNDDKSPWVWKIEGQTITKNNIEDAYEGYLFFFASQFQTTPEELKERLEQIDEVTDPQEKQLLLQLDKKYFAEEGPEGKLPIYKKMLLLNTEAEQSGFLEDKEIASKLKFMRNYFIYNLYLTKKLDINKIDVSDDDALEYFKQIRERDPRYRQIPILKGKEMAKKQLVMQEALSKETKLVNKVLESYKIEQNSDFNFATLFSATPKKKESNEEKETK